MLCIVIRHSLVECGPAQSQCCCMRSLCIVLGGVLPTGFHFLQEKMRPEQFVVNLRGLNGDENFPEAMLLDIYKSIDEHEFKAISPFQI